MRANEQRQGNTLKKKVTDDRAWSIASRLPIISGAESAYLMYCDASLTDHMDPHLPMTELVGGIWWLDEKRKTLGEIRSRYAGTSVFSLNKRQTFEVLARGKSISVDTATLLYSLASMDMPFPSLMVPLLPLFHMGSSISSVLTGSPFDDMEGTTVPASVLLDRTGIVVTMLMSCADGGHSPRHLEVLRFGDGRSTCMDRPMCDVMECYGPTGNYATLGELLAPIAPYIISALEWACYSRSKRTKPNGGMTRKAKGAIRKIEDAGASMWRVVGPIREPGPVVISTPADALEAASRCAHTRRAHYRWLTRRGRWPAEPPRDWDVLRKGDDLGSLAGGLQARGIKLPGFGEWLAVKIVRVRSHDVSGDVDNRLPIRECGDTLHMEKTK